MKNFKSWFSNQKKNISDCADFELDETQADQFLGGFKEYVPPLYEHDSALNLVVNIKDLFSTQGENN